MLTKSLTIGVKPGVSARAWARAAKPRGQRDRVGAGLEPGALAVLRRERGRTHGFDLDRLAAGLGDHDGFPFQGAVDETGKLGFRLGDGVGGHGWDYGWRVVGLSNGLGWAGRQER